jgi:hypothetical protein
MTTQPTLGLGEKTGGAGAPDAGDCAAPKKSRPIATDNEENLDIGTSPLIVIVSRAAR